MTLTDPRHVATREGLVARAIRQRQIAASAADEYRSLYDRDPDTAIRLLTAPVEKGGLMPGVAGAIPEADEYPREWVDQTATAGRVTFEDGAASAAPAQQAPAVAALDSVAFEP